MAGGPPCQGFSRNRAFRHRDGAFVDDPRNHLYWHDFGAEIRYVFKEVPVEVIARVVHKSAIPMPKGAIP